REGENIRRPAVGHSLRRVLTIRPNPWQTPSEFRRMMQANLLLRGNAYAREVTLGGEVRALIPLHPDRGDAEQQDDPSMLYKVQGKDGRVAQLGQRDILH